MTMRSGRSSKPLESNPVEEMDTQQLSLVSSPVFKLIPPLYLDSKIYIIGGWLGIGPLAADDLHILDLDEFKWICPKVTGISPGPCNMHTADAIGREIYVFRGGNGKDYLNDMHKYNVDT